MACQSDTRPTAGTATPCRTGVGRARRPSKGGGRQDADHAGRGTVSGWAGGCGGVRRSRRRGAARRLFRGGDGGRGTGDAGRGASAGGAERPAGRFRVGLRGDLGRLSAHQQPRRPWRRSGARHLPGRLGHPCLPGRGRSRHRPGAAPGAQSAGRATGAGGLRRAAGGPDRDRGRQSAGLRLDRDRGRGQRPRPRAAQPLRPADRRRAADRRRPQPRQFRRAAARQPGPGDRRQHRHDHGGAGPVLRGREQHGPLRHGRDPAAMAGCGGRSWASPARRCRWVWASRAVSSGRR